MSSIFTTVNPDMLEVVGINTRNYQSFMEEIYKAEQQKLLSHRVMRTANPMYSMGFLDIPYTRKNLAEQAEKVEKLKEHLESTYPQVSVYSTNNNKQRKFVIKYEYDCLKNDPRY